MPTLVFVLLLAGPLEDETEEDGRKMKIELHTKIGVGESGDGEFMLE